MERENSLITRMETFKEIYALYAKCSQKQPDNEKVEITSPELLAYYTNYLQQVVLEGEDLEDEDLTLCFHWKENIEKYQDFYHVFFSLQDAKEHILKNKNKPLPEALELFITKGEYRKGHDNLAKANFKPNYMVDKGMLNFFGSISTTDSNEAKYLADVIQSRQESEIQQ